MSIGEVWRWLRSLLRGRSADRDLQREMQVHLELLVEEARSDGASDSAAEDAARRRFGSTLSWREACRDAAGWASVDRLVQDVRFACRALRRDARFSAVAVLVVALGVGGNTAVFSLINAILLNPFPYPQADRLVEVEWQAKTARSWMSTTRVADFGYWRQHAVAFEAVAAYGWSRSNLTAQTAPGFAGPERIVIGTATHGFLGVLGVGPALGRFFTPEEDTPSGPPVAVLSYGAWMRRFGGSPAVLGKTITLDGAVRTIVGVMPKDLVLPGTFTCEAWLPAAYDIAANMRPGYDTRSDGDHVIGRLRTGVSAERATAELRTITHLLDEVLERRSAGMWDVRAVPLGSDLAESGRTALRLVALVVALALLLVCVNLAGLLLARSTSRSHEMAVRASLGAGRARLFRYAVTESLLLALAGGTIGLAIARWGVGAIATAAPPRMGLDSALRIDGTVIGFAFGLSLLTGVVFGLVPAARGSKADLALVLKGTPGAGRPARSGRLLSVLVVGEVALALLLLVGGGLTTRSLLHLMRVDTGVRADRVLTFRISLAGPRYGVEPRRLEFFTALLERVWRMPGVVSTAAVSPLPMSGEYSGSSFAIEGRPAPGNPRDMMSQFCQATPGYFRTMRVPVVRGREFEDGDGAASPVVVVNEELARRYFAGEDPVGHRLARLGTIIGVVGNIRHNGQASGPDPQIYYPVVAKPGRTLSVVVRTSGEPMDIAALVRDAVRALDGDIPVERLKPMEDVEAEAIATPRIVAGLVGGFAVFALVLAGIGLYGVMAYLVNQRQHEIGVRMALGASRRTVVAMIVARGTRLAAAGLVIGMPAALGTVRLASSLLYGLNPYDLVVFASVPLVLLAVALLASYLPARYAASLDPLTALRTE